MRITTYKTYVNEDHHNYLVKESSRNYKSLKSMDSPQSVCRVMRDVFNIHQLAEEHFYLICMNNARVPTAFVLLSKGTVTATLVGIREIFNTALLASAVFIMVCHNHPSGNLRPSERDILLTKKIQTAGELLDISLQDHLIISEDSYYSFAEHRLLEE